jgi:sec-independent protein translocase protein TatC
MLNELKAIRNIFIRLAAAFSAALLAFLFVPLPGTGESASNFAIELMRVHMLPQGAMLAVLNPLDAFFAQASVAASLAVALLLPLLFWEAWHYFSPALLPHERRYLGLGLVCSLALAAMGAAFAYFVLVPVMFTGLYGFLPGGVVAYFSLREMVSMVTGFTVGCALIFLLPLAMVLLSALGLVPSWVWGSYARVAVLLVLVVSAIITPDGSGVGMMLLSVPVCALYGAGYAASKAAARKSSYLATNQ